jgi:catechol-2,3-dioxygenase
LCCQAAWCWGCSRTRPPTANQRFDEFGPGLDHISFGCADRSELEKWQIRLDELGITHGTIAEDAVGFALAFRDPDNLALEFFAPRS